MQDRDFARRWVHWQRFKTDPGPTVVHKQQPLTYEAIRAEVAGLVTKQAGGDLRAAWVQILTAHEGQPDEGAYQAAYRRWQTQDAPDELRAAQIAALTHTESVTKQAADWQPDVFDFLRLRHG
jgi:hypothetical protein